MSTTDVLDAFSRLRRELALIRAAELKDFEIGHGQMLILYRLSLGTASMGELAEWTSADKAATTRAVASLESAGLVRRESHPTDRRVTMIELTPKGKIRAADTHVVRATIVKKINATLTGEERKELARLLNKVATGLQEKRN